jgi:hypothetical protein
MRTISCLKYKSQATGGFASRKEVVSEDGAVWTCDQATEKGEEKEGI